MAHEELGTSVVPTYCRHEGSWWVSALEFRGSGGDSWSPNRALRTGPPERRRACTSEQLRQAAELVRTFPCVPLRVSVHADDCVDLWRQLAVSLKLAPLLELVIVAGGPGQDWAPATELARLALGASGRPRVMLGTDMVGQLANISEVPARLKEALVGYRVSGSAVDGFYSREEQNPAGAARASGALNVALWSMRTLRPDLKIVIEATNPFGTAARVLTASFSPLGVEERAGCPPLGCGSLEIVGDGGPRESVCV